MKTKILVVIGALLCVAAADIVKNQFVIPIYKITIRTIDEQQKPVSGVSVSLAFVNPVYGLTDSKGLFTAEGGCGIAGFGGNIIKDGYYRGGGDIPRPNGNDIDPILNHWLPWNPTVDVMMRPVVKPVAMYARKLAITIPAAINVPCGFDLEIGDWVAPYGKGSSTDFIVTVTKAEQRSNMDYEADATISFPNQGDGIQEIELPKEYANSAFKWPRTAPMTGYQLTLTAHRAWKVSSRQSESININTASEQQAHFFRVRTIGQSGNITSALYGKIKGGFYISPNATNHGFIEFMYYLNPTPLDRNMEFDLKQNLFKNLKDDEKPREP